MHLWLSALVFPYIACGCVSLLLFSHPLIWHAGMNKQAVPRKDTTSTNLQLLAKDNATTARKISLELRMDDQTAARKNSVAAIACEGMQGV